MGTIQIRVNKHANGSLSFGTSDFGISDYQQVLGLFIIAFLGAVIAMWTATEPIILTIVSTLLFRDQGTRFGHSLTLKNMVLRKLKFTAGLLLASAVLYARGGLCTHPYLDKTFFPSAYLPWELIDDITSDFAALLYRFDAYKYTLSSSPFAQSMQKLHGHLQTTVVGENETVSCPTVKNEWIPSFPQHYFMTAFLARIVMHLSLISWLAEATKSSGEGGFECSTGAWFFCPLISGILEMPTILLAVGFLALIRREWGMLWNFTEVWDTSAPAPISLQEVNEVSAQQEGVEGETPPPYPSQ
ncbi:hypothetical protein SISSUDRAFT_1050354 [Sistotremastrum suecicum HHB10207 ss-3]|uniref:Uncharacterized protein n=1 Tax=Sistotremastrum suecicum HHB10207 ss-3 TaxID=1314776 RepID=A0A166B9S2_9AGAM|nr:hypothetical protein SISSUDRAFT_1050354 [Sistotremastrum suecicum HHB10207 ss-3]